MRRFDPYDVSLGEVGSCRWTAGRRAAQADDGTVNPCHPMPSPRHLLATLHQENGGTILAVSSSDFVIVGSDTRQSEGYSIQTRYTPRLFPLTNSGTVIAVQGFQGDCSTFVKRLKQRLEVSWDRSLIRSSSRGIILFWPPPVALLACIRGPPLPISPHFRTPLRPRHWRFAPPHTALLQTSCSPVSSSTRIHSVFPLFKKSR